jgi:hypothetical protein
VVVADLVRTGGLIEMSWWRRPVVHFIVIGAVLFGAKTLFMPGQRTSADPERAVIVITAERIAELRDDWIERTRTAPRGRDLEALIGAAVADELLIREARRRGLHRSDSVVQRRLLKNMQFVETDPGRSPAELLEEAYALGMDESDLVVRRRLVQKIQLELQGAVRTPEPTEAELLDYMARHEDRFVQPPRVLLTHVFLSRDRRGDALLADSEGLLERLIRDGVGPDAAGALGDPFLFDRSLSPRSERELAKVFGPDFAARAFELPTGRWVGPVASAYGMHLVWVQERVPSAPTPLSVVEREVREGVFSERGQRALQEFLETLRAKYEVRIEADDSSEGAEP